MLITALMLWKIQHMRSYLDQDAVKIVVQALIMSKLDYCNSLLIRSAEYQLDKLQRIQNMTSRVIFNLKKFGHISAHMKNLHWLRIRERIQYKIPTLFFNAKMVKPLDTQSISYPRRSTMELMDPQHMTIWNLHSTRTYSHPSHLSHLQLQEFGRVYCFIYSLSAAHASLKWAKSRYLW